MRAAQQRADDVLTRWVAARDQGITLPDFALAEGMKLDTAQSLLRRARARGDERGNWTPPPRKVVRPKFNATLAGWNEAEPGLTYAEVAEEIGTTRDALNTVLARARREGLEVRKAVSRRAAIAAEEWEHLREGGVSIHEAAQRLNVTIEYLRGLS
jgi:hypothetical protein